MKKLTKSIFVFGAIVCTVLALGEMVARFLVYTEKPTQSYYRLMDAKYEIASRLYSDSHPLIVLVGSSLMTRGIFPELVQYKLRQGGLDAKVVNLAAPAQNQIEAADILRYVLGRVHPALVLGDYDPVNSSSLVPPPVARDSYLSRCLINSPQFFSGRLRCKIETVSYLLRFRSHWKYQIIQFSKIVFNRQAFERESRIGLTDAVLSEISHLGSAPVMDTFPFEQLPERMFGYIKWFAETGPRNPASQFSNQAYLNLAHFAAEEKVNYGLLWLPHYKSFYERYFYTAKQDHDFYARSLESSFKPFGGHVIDINHLEDDGLNFDDVRHLNTYGAVEASKLLAEALLREPYKSLISGKHP